MRSPRSFVITRTRPTAVPAMMMSPVWSVPFCTRTVMIGPRPLSRRASTTVPRAGRFGLALSSMISACSTRFSRSSLTPAPVFAEIGQTIVSPPHSSGTRSYLVRSCLMRSGFAPGRSILLIATTIGVPAALAWLMDSIVCGMMPSSAATTRMAISVTIAPRARMVVKASWPGVSRKVTGLPLTITRYAPMCCVMPPASPATTFALRMRSSREVLPWSTWPMTTTTGARGTSSSSVSTWSSIRRSSTVTTTSCSTLQPSSMATSAAVS